MSYSDDEEFGPEDHAPDGDTSAIEAREETDEDQADEIDVEHLPEMACDLGRRHTGTCVVS